jgi:hypothetical protein
MASNLGSVEIDFGATPTDTAQVTITTETLIPAGAAVEAFIMFEASSQHTAEDHKALAIMCGPPIAGNVVAGQGFDIFLFARGGKFAGKYMLRWVWNG